jgi:signal transduction histidine kinase
MSLVFPNSLAAKTSNLALSRGAYWFGIVCLGSVFLSLALIQLDRSSREPWAAMLAVLAIAAAGTLLARPGGDRLPVIAGATALALAGSTLFAAVLLPNLGGGDAGGQVFLSLVAIAIVFFGAIACRSRPGVVGIVVASIVAEAPVVVVSLLIDRPLAALLAILALLSFSRRRSRSSEPVLSRASADDRRATEAARAAHSSSALLHDTILNELAVVAAVAPGPLTQRAREQMARSLRLVDAGGHARADAPEVASGPAAGARLSGDLAAAVEWAAANGLDVTVVGDVSALGSLPARSEEALGLAVRQCLANVVAHSGVGSAELTVIATETELCVMVIDAGVGFAESDAATDRMGIRLSVRGRIAAAGGTVQVWSSPGAGTAISMSVPR